MNNEPTDAEYRASLERAMATADLLVRLRESEARVERLTADLREAFWAWDQIFVTEWQGDIERVSRAMRALEDLALADTKEAK